MIQRQCCCVVGRDFEIARRNPAPAQVFQVMTRVKGNQSRAATILGINRGTLRKKLKEFGIGE